jgi:nucleotide-binding universal stress UspA family protein
MLDAGEDVGPALLEAAQEVAADLLVAGAYGRPRLAEWVLGGVTRHLLRHSTLPMLLRH